MVFTLVFIGPLYCMFTDGLKSATEAVAGAADARAGARAPGHYVQRLGPDRIARLLFNTLYYAAGALAFQLIFDIAAAYALSKLRPMFGNAGPRPDAGDADDPGHWCWSSRST